MNFLENFGSPFIFMLILPFQYLIKHFLHIYRGMKCCKKIKSYLQQSRKDTFLNAYQRLLVESFMEILICSYISLQDNVMATRSDRFSKSFVYVCLTLALALVTSGVYFVSFGSKKMLKSSKLLTRNRRFEEQKFP